MRCAGKSEPAGKKRKSDDAVEHTGPQHRLVLRSALDHVLGGWSKIFLCKKLSSSRYGARCVKDVTGHDRRCNGCRDSWRRRSEGISSVVRTLFLLTPLTPCSSVVLTADAWGPPPSEAVPDHKANSFSWHEFSSIPGRTGVRGPVGSGDRSPSATRFELHHHAQAPSPLLRDGVAGSATEHCVFAPLVVMLPPSNGPNIYKKEPGGDCAHSQADRRCVKEEMVWLQRSRS